MPKEDKVLTRSYGAGYISSDVCVFTVTARDGGEQCHLLNGLLIKDSGKKYVGIIYFLSFNI